MSEPRSLLIEWRRLDNDRRIQELRAQVKFLQARCFELRRLELESSGLGSEQRIAAAVEEERLFHVRNGIDW